MKPIADISAWQLPDRLDYDRLVASTSGVILRACAGTYKDRWVEKHYEEITKRGGLVGFYQFIYGTAGMTNQVEAFREVLDGKVWQLGLWADVEKTTYSTLGKNQLEAYLECARERLPGEIGIYTSQYMWDSMIGGKLAGEYKLWVANYEARTPALPKTGGWKTWWLWQYTSRGQVEGMAEVVDLSWFNGGVEAFAQWTGVAVQDPVARLEGALVRLCAILGIEQERVFGEGGTEG